MGLRADLRYRVDRRRKVRRVGHRDQRCPFGEQGLEVGDVEHPRHRVDLPLLDGDAGLGQTAPRADVGLVVLVGDDDLVALAHPGPERMAEHIGVLGGRRAEVDLAGRAVEGGRQTSLRLVHGVAGGLRWAEVPVRLDLGRGEEVAEPVDHLARHVAAAGVLEVRPGRCVGVRERRELRTDEVDIERGHRRQPTSRPVPSVRLASKPGDRTGSGGSPGAVVWELDGVWRDTHHPQKPPT